MGTQEEEDTWRPKWEGTEKTQHACWKLCCAQVVHKEASAIPLNQSVAWLQALQERCFTHGWITWIPWDLACWCVVEEPPQMDPNVPYTSLKTSLVIGNKWKNICSAHGSTQENGLSFDRFHLGLGGCQVRFVRFDSLDSFDLKETWIQWIIQWIIWSYTWLRVVIQGCMILPWAAHDISVSEKQLIHDETCLYNDILWFGSAWHCLMVRKLWRRKPSALGFRMFQDSKWFKMIQTYSNLLYFLNLLAGPEAVRVRLPVPPLCWHLRWMCCLASWFASCL